MDAQRRVMRVSLPEPAEGTAADEPIYVVDASLRGVRISHRKLSSPRADIPIAFEFDGKDIELSGSIGWTKFAKSVYQSGVEIVSMNSAHDAEHYSRDRGDHDLAQRGNPNAPLHALTPAQVSGHPVCRCRLKCPLLVY